MNQKGLYQTIFSKLFFIMIFVNIVFPKAGFKLSGIPITIGMLLFFAVFFMSLFIKNSTRYSKYNGYYKYVLMGLFILAIRFFIMVISYLISKVNSNFSSGFFQSFLAGGAYFTFSLGDFFSYFSTLCFFPVVLFFLPKAITSEKELKKLKKIIVFGTYIIIIYGILQIFFGIENIAIPGLTVNLSDFLEYGSNWFTFKHNTYDSGTKIVSTYQNGNLFGVNLVILFPIAFYFYNPRHSLYKIIFLALFLVAVVMTLSRSVWFGAMIYVVYLFITFKPKKRTASVLKIILPVFVGIVLLIMIFKIDFLRSRILSLFSFSSLLELGGRTKILQDFFGSVINNPLSAIGMLIGFESIIDYSSFFTYEMLQMGIIILTGLLGLSIWTCILFFPYFITKNKVVPYVSVFVYYVMALIEGAYWLLPTAINLFLVVGIFIAQKSLFPTIDDKRCLNEKAADNCNSDIQQA